MLTVEEARERVLSHFHPLPVEEVSLNEALGRVLAEAAIAREALPGFANSAMAGRRSIERAMPAADSRASIHEDRYATRFPLLPPRRSHRSIDSAAPAYSVQSFSGDLLACDVLHWR
jgi:hypothetical protein